MPSWGRPSGAGKGKREKRRDKYTRQQEGDRRFEEIDSDEDDDQGVELDRSHISDKLYFTGTDISPRRRNPHSPDYDRSSESSGAEDVAEDMSEGTMQIALRDKEELLVQKALERIRRAQMMGRSNVELTQSEIDALERKRRKDSAARKVTGSKAKISERRRVSDQSAGVVSEQKPNRRKVSAPVSAYDGHGSSSPRHSTPPGIVVPGPDGNPVYSAFGQYPSLAVNSYGRSSRSGSRSTGAQSQQQHTPPLPGSQARPAQTRYFSGSDHSQPSSTPQTPLLSRRLPDDPGWIPRPRSASSNHSYSAENIHHNSLSPQLPHASSQFNQGRRNISGPPDVQYTSRRRGAPPTRAYAATSDPSLPQRDLQDGALDHRGYVDYSDDDDDGNYGVQVDLAPYDQGYGTNSRTGDYGGGRLRRGER